LIRGVAFTLADRCLRVAASSAVETVNQNHGELLRFANRDRTWDGKEVLPFFFFFFFLIPLFVHQRTRGQHFIFPNSDWLTVSNSEAYEEKNNLKRR
jgi:hypothetical protein